MTRSQVSKEFSQVAEVYDATRGGMARGRQWSTVLERHLVPGRVLEVGVGTGVVAAGLAERGRRVSGVDLSEAMLRRAQRRVGNVVVRGDAQRLPIRSGCCANVLAAWVVDVVADPVALLCEVARVLAPGGRLLVVTSVLRQPPDAIGEVVFPMVQALARALPPDHPEALAVTAAAAGLRLRQERGRLTRFFTQSPAESADGMERRLYPQLWGIDDQEWARTVVPVIAALRALPDPQRPLHRQHVYEVLAIEPNRPR